MAERFLTERDLFSSFNIPARTAQRWRITGDGPPFIRVGKAAHPVPVKVTRPHGWRNELSGAEPLNWRDRCPHECEAIAGWSRFC